MLLDDGNSSHRNELTAFLDVYVRPAAILNVSARVLYQNSPFERLHRTHGPALLSLLGAAVEGQRDATETFLPATRSADASGAGWIDDSLSVEWVLTYQRVGDGPRRVIVLAKEHPRLVPRVRPLDLSFDVESSSSIPRALSGHRAWLSDPRFKGLATGGGEMGDHLRALDWSKIFLSMKE
jgi:hypothetical protein